MYAYLIKKKKNQVIKICLISKRWNNEKNEISLNEISITSFHVTFLFLIIIGKCREKECATKRKNYHR